MVREGGGGLGGGEGGRVRAGKVRPSRNDEKKKQTKSAKLEDLQNKFQS